MAAESPSDRPPSSRRARALGWLFAAGCVVFGATLRIHAALDDPNFDAADARGMVKSDPALLYYLTEQVVEAHGAVPDDFGADPRIEHPEPTDVPATFTLGQEFALAWTYLLTGGALPLHVFCTVFLGIWASLTPLCIYGLALELTGRITWAALAAALFAALPANYRTVGWVLMNEDFAIPWFALHLWLLARAARVRTRTSLLQASLALGLALSTWHAMSFFVALEAACVFLWFQRTVRNPFAAHGAWIVPVTLLVFAVGVPALRQTAFALSLPMQLILALWAAAQWRRPGPRIVAWLALGLLLLAALGWTKFTGGGIGEYAHVYALIGAKLRHFGVLPADPSELSVEVRMMWQGPFATLGLADGLSRLGVSALALVPALALVFRAARSPRAASSENELLLAMLACASMPAAWLIERTVLLPGLLLPVVGTVAAARFVETRTWRRAALAVATAAVLWQGWTCLERIETTPIAWYVPPERNRERAALLEELPRLVPAGEAIAADFMTSTAILAFTGHPIVFQPKWESRRSRARAVELFDAFYHQSPDELRRRLLDKYRCRYLVVDRAFFGIQLSCLYIGGLRDGVPLAGTCAEVFLSQDEAVLSSVPGYRLIYRSPGTMRFASGRPTDYYRVYELAP